MNFLTKSFLLFIIALSFPVIAQQPTDQQIRQTLIQQSIMSYPGNCPCPYNRASNGSRCGGRSAYSRAGGYSPLCYDRDVTDEMVRRYRAKGRY